MTKPDEEDEDSEDGFVDVAFLAAARLFFKYRPVKSVAERRQLASEYVSLAGADCIKRSPGTGARVDRDLLSRNGCWLLATAALGNWWQLAIRSNLFRPASSSFWPSSLSSRIPLKLRLLVAVQRWPQRLHEEKEDPFSGRLWTSPMPSSLLLSPLAKRFKSSSFRSSTSLLSTLLKMRLREIL